MGAILRAVVVSIVLTAPVLAQDVQPADPAIEGTIQGQIDAFLIDDFVTAFTFASPNIQGLFGDADRFGSMVRNGYPMVWRPDSVQFLELEARGGQLWQKVMVRDQAGQFHVLAYQMVEMDGRWRINGVQLLPAPDLGV